MTSISIMVEVSLERRDTYTSTNLLLSRDLFSDENQALEGGLEHHHLM